MKILPFMLILASALFSQTVIINEMSQGAGGNQEWVELLVMQSATDLRGWQLGDNDDGNWHSIVQFAENQNLSNMAQGSIIVVYNDGDTDSSIVLAGGPDVDIADNVLLLPVSDSNYLIDVGPWPGAGAFANSDKDDCPSIRDPSGAIIHDMAGSHTTASVPSPGVGECKYFTGNSLDDISNDLFWETTQAIEATPGALNGGSNSSWFDTSLPVELVSLSAGVVDALVRLTWVTASEIENQGFIIQRSSPDRGGYLELASFVENPSLRGQGSSTEGNVYKYVDSQVRVGQRYSYRLKDVDYAGKTTILDSVEIVAAPKDEGFFPTSAFIASAYPNPFNSSLKLQLKPTRDEITGIIIAVHDVKGSEVRRLWQGSSLDLPTVLTWNGNLMHNEPAPAGVYLITVRNPSAFEAKRVLLLR